VNTAGRLRWRGDRPGRTSPQQFKGSMMRKLALLAEAGYPNGFATEIVSPLLPQWGD
jgi:hypothetical protein